MATGKEPIKGHIQGFRKEIAKASEHGPERFFNWFDESGGDVDFNYLKGHCEFVQYFLTPALRFLDNPRPLRALEIGFGGGRLLAAASGFFHHVTGIDIHGNGPMVAAELKKRGIDNFTLHQNDGKSLPVEDRSIDFLYSFIVLQHVEHIDIFKSYFAETYRVLDTGGIAILFFERMATKSNGKASDLWYAVDRTIERLDPRGYKERVAKVNCTNLKVSLGFAKSMARELGFEVLDDGVSRRLPDTKRYGAQHCVILRK